MAFLLALSGLFAFLALKEIFGKKIVGRNIKTFDAYFFLMLALSVACAWLPVSRLIFEKSLASVAEQLSGVQGVKVDCDSVMESSFHLGYSGYVYRGSNQIDISYLHCGRLKEYRDDPSKYSSDKHLFSLHVFTHEAMHVAGEFVESKADCMAIQRNHRTARLLGASSDLADSQARYLHRNRGLFSGPGYFSAECEPGKSLDENLPDAVWKKSTEAK